MKIPKQYKTGIAYFMDFEFKVSPNTFIPRPETELLVGKALEAAKAIYKLQTSAKRSEASPKGTNYKLQGLDIGSGCGNIAISLTKYLTQSKITALDISYEAIRVARENARLLGVADKIEFIKGNLFDALKEKQNFDIIVANPPYISEKDMRTLPSEVKREPWQSLYGGIDGLDFFRIIIAGATKYLKKRAFLFMEIGYDQAEDVKGLLQHHNYRDIELYKDYNGIDRVVKAKVSHAL